MAIEDHYLRIPLEQIHVAADRQRRAIDVTDLIPSIRIRGVVHPIIVERFGDNQQSYQLIAGERRLTASRQLGLPNIPARLTSDLSGTEKQILELEENIKRRDLIWQDEALAVQRIHKLYLDTDPNWTHDNTNEVLGFTGRGMVSVYLQVAEEVTKGNKNVLSASGLRAAYNMIARRTDRAVADAMNDFLSEPEVQDAGLFAYSDSGTDNSGLGNGAGTESGGNIRSNKNDPTIPPESILNLSFLNFAPTYSGPPFNFLHCDFPYGIGHHKSDQGNSEQWGGYDDSEDTYWTLCQALCANLDRLVAPSAHILFWLSSDIERQIATVRFFAASAPSLTFRTVPLIWLKTDNKGILPDPARGPRQIYETALFASRGDRLIVRAVSNAYGSPGTKELHQSEKPEPMLRHFFSMFIDENSRVLDPTCGSGTSLRAAESLGAKEVLGLEIDEKHVEGARIALRRSRVLRQAEEIVV